MGGVGGKEMEYKTPELLKDEYVDSIDRLSFVMAVVNTQEKENKDNLKYNKVYEHLIVLLRRVNWLLLEEMGLQEKSKKIKVK